MHVFGEKEKGINYIKREAVYGLVSKDKKVLAISSKKRLFLPGGGIEHGESHFECLKREFLEETGYMIEIDAYLGCAKSYDFVKELGKYFEMIGYFYIVRLKNKYNDVNENIQQVYIQKNRLKNYPILSHHLWAIKKYIKVMKL